MNEKVSAPPAPATTQSGHKPGSVLGFQRDALHPTGTVHVVQKGAAHTFRISDDAAWDYLDITGARLVMAMTRPLGASGWPPALSATPTDAQEQEDLF